jgi:hypothetical protein
MLPLAASLEAWPDAVFFRRSAMPRARAALSALLVVLALSASACASAAGRRSEATNRISVRVQNDLVVPSVLTIFIVDDLGTRRLIGNVPANATNTLGYEPSLPSGRYRLMGRTTSGAEIVSPPITATAGETVVWRLSTNITSVE